MATLIGTVSVAGRMGDLNKLIYVRGVYALAAAFSTADTIEFDFFGSTELNGYNFIPVSGRYFGVRTETNATPVGQFSIGDSADPDGLLTAKSGFTTVTNSQPIQQAYEFDGALIANGTALTGTKVIITPTVNPTTGTTSGNIIVEGWFKAVAKNA